VGERRTVFHHQDALAAQGRSVSHRNGARRFHQLGPGIELAHRALGGGHLLGSGRVHLVDHHHVRHAHHGFARMIVPGMLGAVRVHHRDQQIGRVERKIVVAPVPEQDLRFPLSGLEDPAVVHAGIDHVPRCQQRLELLPLFDGGMKPLQILGGRKALDRLLDQVTVRHRVAHHHHPASRFPQDRRNPPGGLALAGAGPRRTDGHDRDRRAEHGMPRTQQQVIRSRRQGLGGQVHDMFVGDVRVTEDHHVHLLLSDHSRQFAFGIDRHTVRIPGPGQLGGIPAAGDVRNLSGGEPHHLVVGAIAEPDVEVVKIASRRPQNQNPLHMPSSPFGSGGPRGLPPPPEARRKAGGRRRQPTTGTRV